VGMRQEFYKDYLSVLGGKRREQLGNMIQQNKLTGQGTVAVRLSARISIYLSKYFLLMPKRRDLKQWEDNRFKSTS
jgi:hypothetical protein